jgi:hypothetical protein
MFLRRLLCPLLIACHLLAVPTAALAHCPHASKPATASPASPASHDHAAMGHAGHAMAQAAPDGVPSHCQCGCACQDRDCAPGGSAALSLACPGGRFERQASVPPSSSPIAMPRAAYQQPRLRPPTGDSA